MHMLSVRIGSFPPTRIGGKKNKKAQSGGRRYLEGLQRLARDVGGGLGEDVGGGGSGRRDGRGGPDVRRCDDGGRGGLVVGPALRIGHHLRHPEESRGQEAVCLIGRFPDKFSSSSKTPIQGGLFTKPEKYPIPHPVQSSAFIR